MSINQEPKFVKTFSYVQKILASIAVSMFFVVWISGWDIVQNVFKPNFENALAWFRMLTMGCALACTAFVGLTQLGSMLQWVVDNYELLKKLKEIKKEQDKDTLT